MYIIIDGVSKQALIPQSACFACFLLVDTQSHLHASCPSSCPSCPVHPAPTCTYLCPGSSAYTGSCPPRVRLQVRASVLAGALASCLWIDWRPANVLWDHLFLLIEIASHLQSGLWADVVNSRESTRSLLERCRQNFVLSGINAGTDTTSTSK